MNSNPLRSVRAVALKNDPRTALKSSALVLAMGLSASGVFGAGSAFDTAANYVGTWGTSAANLGSGFGAWSFTLNNNNSPPYVGTYLDQTSYGNADGALSAGYAWGTYANGGTGNGSFVMSRPFMSGGGSASLVNQTFSALIGSGGVGGAGSALTLGIGTAFSISYTGGGTDNMLLSVDGGAGTVVPVNFASLQSGVLVSLSVSGPVNSESENYSLAFSPAAGGSLIYSTSGTFDSSQFDTASFIFTDLNTSGNGYANNIMIAPEPSSLMLLAAGAGAARFFLRRRKS